MHPFLRQKPVAIAHRGGAGAAPENTIAAFENAVSRGYTYLETDVHVTSDGIVVAFHDDALDRVSDKSGHINSLSITQVESADAGYWFSPDGGLSYPYRGQGLTVPRLSDLLARFPTACFNIDPKQDGTVLPLLKVLQEFDAFDRCCIGAFSDARLGRIRRLTRGRACTSMGPKAVAVNRLGSLLGVVATLEADCIQIPVRFGRVRLVDDRMVAACHRRGIPVHVWTVNTAEEATALLDLGVDGIMTDDIEMLARVFEGRGLSLSGA